jgi:hypothetical protein
VPQGSVLGSLLFNVFINDICHSINHSKFLIFADNLKIFPIIDTPHDCLLVLNDIHSVSDWCSANSMSIDINKTSVTSYSRKTNVLLYGYQLCRTAITRTSCVKDLGVSFDTKLYFHNHVDFIFSECMKLLGLIHSITFRFSSLNSLYVLYQTLVRSKLEYATVAGTLYHVY